MIVSGGYNIWPAELETVIADHPDVVEVAVFTVPDPRWGEAPMAVVCTTVTAAASESDPRSRCGSAGAADYQDTIDYWVATIDPGGCAPAGQRT